MDEKQSKLEEIDRKYGVRESPPEGHEFYGNQYTGGGGSSDPYKGTRPSAGMKSKGEPDRIPALTHSAISKKMGAGNGTAVNTVHGALQQASKGKEATQAFIDSAEDENLSGNRPNIVKIRNVAVKAYKDYVGNNWNQDKYYKWENVQRGGKG